MTAREMQKNGLLYTLDEDLWASHINAKRITRELNATLETENPRRRELVQELFAAAGEGAYVEPPFHIDYGCNTRVGDHFYCSYDCAFLDCGQITIGNRVMLGPKVGLYAVNHPIDPVVRATGLEHAKPITIGDNVWIGGSAVVCPGVTIGSNVVIGAGSEGCSGRIQTGTAIYGNGECIHGESSFPETKRLGKSPVLTLYV